MSSRAGKVGGEDGVRIEEWWSWTQRRNEVRWRPGHETSFALPCSNLRCFGSECTVLTEVLVTLLGLFGAWGSVTILLPLDTTLRGPRGVSTTHRGWLSPGHSPSDRRTTVWSSASRSRSSSGVSRTRGGRGRRRCGARGGWSHGSEAGEKNAASNANI